MVIQIFRIITLLAGGVCLGLALSEKKKEKRIEWILWSVLSYQLYDIARTLG